ncbi:MAG TPA: hypothetical protein VK843_09695 [Planctomycetota bacterium]|nr:hypothetical protein [Planctomycetota bacterium]
MQNSKLRRRGAIAVLCLGSALGSASCATMTGLITGAFTGAVDAPAEIYRHHPDEFRDHPSYWSFNILVFVPVGFVLGPVVGFAKGIALDMEKLLGQTDYGPVFGNYDKISIWRPYTFGWHPAPKTPR